MLKKIFLFFIIELALTTSAHANGFTKNTDIVSLRLIPELTTLSAETKELTIITEGEIKEGWHLYWDNPGDTGDPTTLTFQENSHYTPIKESHSSPQKAIFEEIITSYFYRNKFYFKTLFKIDDISDSKLLPFMANLSYTACKESCYSEEISLEFALPIGIEEEQNPTFFKVLMDSDKAFPTLLSATAIIQNKSAHIKTNKTCPNAEFVSIYPKRNILADLPQTSVSSTGFTVDFGEDDLPPDLSGLVLCPEQIYYISPLIDISDVRFDFGLLIYYILTALLAGLILNLMPCVLPILSLKALYLAQHKKKVSIFSAFAYFIGVICSFLILAGILFYLRTDETAVGWGFQLQSPLFNTVLLLLFFLIFLNLTDKFPLPEIFTDKLSKLTDNQSFLTGFFAVIIACPCTGPFMGAALGYAITQPAIIYFTIFLSLGIGYALPYTLIELFPNICLKYIPKPGHWILVMKRVLSVPIALTCLWLGWIIYNQLNPFAAQAEKLNWEPYTAKAVDQAIEQKEKVFIDFTAKWCLVCLVNDKTTLNSKDFEKLVKEKHIRLFKADWTNHDTAIRSALAHYGRNSIPLYIYYSGDNDFPVILPQILTTDILKRYFN